MLTATPTTYANINFRSRLEADYAATFTSMGLAWQYEPEGYRLSDGTWYSPDFYLPTARAWVEVKGDHQERVSKVEQFAADQWEAAKQPHYESPTAPLVVIAASPRNYWLEVSGFERDPDSHWKPQFLGVRGIGKRYSIAVTHCDHCRQTTMIALWAKTCRNCGRVYHDEEWGMAEFEEDPLRLNVYKYWDMPFVRVPRPVGRKPT